MRFLHVALLATILASEGVPSAAAGQAATQRLELGGISLNVSHVELVRLSELRDTFEAPVAVQDRALAAARAVVASPDGRHVLALYQLEIARRRGEDDALRSEALDVLIASNLTPPEKLPEYLAVRGGIAFRARDYQRAATLWERVMAAQPDNPQLLVNLAQVRLALGDAVTGVALIRRALNLPRQDGAPAPELWYRQRLSIASNGGLVAEANTAAQALIAAYPTPENWRLALVIYRQSAAPQGPAEIDLLRLMFVTGAFRQAAEYQRLSQLLLQSGLISEARRVLEAGITQGIVVGNASPTPEIFAEMERAARRQYDPPPAQADILFGEGRFAEAAAAYRRVASADPASGTRSGVALALAGRREEAESAFRAVSGAAPAGNLYADLARFWTAWLTRPA